MTSRHHYSIPGASLLKPRGSSKTRQEKVPTSTNVPTSSRDPRQPSSSRAYYPQETPTPTPRAAPPARPPSTSGYKTQQPNASTSTSNFHAPGGTRPPPAQRVSMAPQASSSRTRLDAPEPRGYFSKMFSRKTATPNPGPGLGAAPAMQGEERHRSSSSSANKARRMSQAYPATMQQQQQQQQPPPQQSTVPSSSANWPMSDVAPRTRDSDREDREKARQKAREDRGRADRPRERDRDREREREREKEKEKEERARAEYAAYRAKMDDAEHTQAALASRTATATATRMDRAASRPSREERRQQQQQQEYESDAARRRVGTAAAKQEARQSYYLHPAAVQSGMPAMSRTGATARDASQSQQQQQQQHQPQQTPAPQPQTQIHPQTQPQPAARPLGIPVQPSTSSQSTNASHQQVPAQTQTQTHLNATPAPALAPARMESTPAPPVVASPLPALTTQTTKGGATAASAVAPLQNSQKVNQSYQMPNSSYAFGGQGQSSSQNQNMSASYPSAPGMLQSQSFVQDERNRVAREAAEREALLLLSREKEREREREREAEVERKREAEVARQEREREREREREAEMERRREAEVVRQEREREREREREAEIERRREAEAARQEKEREAEAEAQRRREAELARLEREREHEAEMERRRVAELARQAAEREVLASRERERERELERRREVEQEERRRARRAERERKKELEAAERERQKEAELERQREKEWLKQEKERRREAERVERERLVREKAEREKAVRATPKHRSYRDKTQSMPTNPPPGAGSGSDTDRMSRRDGRHRAQSHPISMAIETQPFALQPDNRRPEMRRDSTAPAVSQLTAQISASKQDFPNHTPSHFVPESPMPIPIPPPQIERHDQILYPRSASVVPLPTQAPELSHPKMPDRSHTDPLLPSEIMNGGMQASAAPPLWPQTLNAAAQPKLVSIYASQGPPDRTPSRAMQKMAPSLPTTEQRMPAPSQTTTASASNAHEANVRPSLDLPSNRPPTALANSPAQSITPAAAPTPALQAHTQLELPTSYHAPSAATLRQFMSNLPPSSTPEVITPLPPATPMPKLAPRPQSVLVSSFGKPLPSPQLYTQPTSTPNTQQAEFAATQQPSDDRPTSTKPPATAFPRGAGFSSYSQTILGASSQDNQSELMARVPSNNSARSPQHKAAELPTDPPAGAFPAIPISRAASEESQTTETGENRQAVIPHSQPQTHITSLQPQQQQSNSATPMYTSTQNVSSTSRGPHESTTNLHQQSVFPTHSHSQSLPQTSYPHGSSNVESGPSRSDNLSNARTAAPSSAVTSDANHQTYPSAPQSFSQGKVNYNSSSNAFLSMQSQQSQPVSSLSTQDNNPPPRPTTHTNNLSSYATAIATNSLSHTPSTMLSQQTVPSLNSSVYHNSSASRFHVPIHQSQQPQQTPAATFRPPLLQHNISQVSTATIKPPGLTTGHTNSSNYVTSTRQAGPFIDDTPSSMGVGLSLDSPPPDPRPPLQHPFQSADRSTPQPGHIKPNAGPPLNSAQGVNQTPPLPPPTQAQKAGTPQDLDSPPPLTPSSSSHDSHEEVLMTPASLDHARTQRQGITATLHASDTSLRSEKEKKKGGIFGLFRSSSTKPTKEKDNIRAEPRGYEARRPVQGPSHDQRPESENKIRSSRPPSIVITAESNPNPKNVGPMGMSKQMKQSRTSTKRAPPPIAIPSQSIPYRLFTPRSRRYRTMSSASMEALDGTANNTVVGSPTSSRRSPTPSGPLTPPIRDPIEATQVWRSNEDVFLEQGSHRRRRPGVTFDGVDDVQKDGGQYRRLSSRQRGQRRDPSR